MSVLNGASDLQVWPLYGPKLFDAFMATGNFAPAECIETTPASKASMPGGFAMGCNCGEDPREVADGKKLLLTYTVPAGEGTKCREVKAAIEDFMVSQSQPAAAAAASASASHSCC